MDVHGANFDRSWNRVSLPQEANDPTMKKRTIVSVLVIAIALLFTACSKGHSCPAYGKVRNVPAEHRS
jgi:hypothetical protein